MKHLLLLAIISMASSAFAGAMKDTVFYNGEWSSGFGSVGNVLHANSKNKERILEKCSALYSNEYCDKNLVYSRVLSYRGKRLNHLPGNASYMMGTLKGKPFVKNIVVEEKWSVTPGEINRVCEEASVWGRRSTAYFSVSKLSKLVAFKSATLQKSTKADLANSAYYLLSSDGQRYSGSEWKAKATDKIEIQVELDKYYGLTLSANERDYVCGELTKKLKKTLASKKIDLMNDYVFGTADYNYSYVTNSLDELEEVFQHTSK